MASDPKCPICTKPAKPRAENTAFPFCSARCKTVDLGKWLSEEYRVPLDEEPDEEALEEALKSAASKSRGDMRH